MEDATYSFSDFYDFLCFRQYEKKTKNDFCQ